MNIQTRSSTTESKLRALPGYLVKCDVALKSWLIHLDSQQSQHDKFILRVVDDNHLFIKKDPHIQKWLIDRMDEWYVVIKIILYIAHVGIYIKLYINYLPKLLTITEP